MVVTAAAAANAGQAAMVIVNAAAAAAAAAAVVIATNGPYEALPRRERSLARRVNRCEIAVSNRCRR